MANLRVELVDGRLEARLEAFDSCADLLADLETAPASGEARVALLWGSGFRSEEATTSAAEARSIERFEFPTIFAISGTLTPAATQVALSCDIRCASPDASFRVPIGSRRAMTLIGIEGSAELLPARGRVDAAAALKHGLVSQVSAQDSDLLADARELAMVVASRGPIAVKLAKEAIWRGLELPLEHALRFETDLTLLLQTTKDRAEGVRAFLEKRQPHFTGE